MNFHSKYLKYKKKYLDLKNSQIGGSYYLENPSGARSFTNIDLWDTFPDPTVVKLYDGTLDQPTINKLLLTGILTVNNKIEI